MLVLLFLFNPIKEQYLVYRVHSAETPGEEVEAFDLVRRWGGRTNFMPWPGDGYRVSCFDESGSECFPHKGTSRYDEVVSIQIEFASGVSIRKTLNTPGNLGTLMGE